MNKHIDPCSPVKTTAIVQAGKHVLTTPVKQHLEAITASALLSSTISFEGIRKLS